MSVKELTDITLPLRQSCDRCRELKVRCKPSPTINIFGGNGLPMCVRCTRARANCAYSRKASDSAFSGIWANEALKSQHSSVLVALFYMYMDTAPDSRQHLHDTIKEETYMYLLS